MMKSEFIERTGFEPTAEEYKEIEAEYLGCDIDKDQFCEQWKKQGGAERLMRRRAYRIEELEAEVANKDRQFEKRTAADAKRYRELFDKDRQQIQRMEDENAKLLKSAREAENRVNAEMRRADEAERKLQKIRDAFEIMFANLAQPVRTPEV